MIHYYVILNFVMWSTFRRYIHRARFFNESRDVTQKKLNRVFPGGSQSLFRDTLESTASQLLM